jgi:hypothetical protein
MRNVPQYVEVLNSILFAEKKDSGDFWPYMIGAAVGKGAGALVGAPAYIKAHQHSIAHGALKQKAMMDVVTANPELAKAANMGELEKAITAHKEFGKPIGEHWGKMMKYGGVGGALSVAGIAGGLYGVNKFMNRKLKPEEVVRHAQV